MEDAHIHLLQMPNDPMTAFFAVWMKYTELELSWKLRRQIIFKVFDGHGGARIAKYASQFLHKQIAESKAYGKKESKDLLIVN